MVYNWSVNINGKKHLVKAVNSWTAVSRCLDKKDLQGTIVFKRLQNIKMIKCDICGKTYQDNPESKKHHFEVYFFHKEAVKRIEQTPTTIECPVCKKMQKVGGGTGCYLCENVVGVTSHSVWCKNSHFCEARDKENANL